MRSDIRNFFHRLPGLFRDDFSAIMLVIANTVPVINLLVKGEPISLTIPDDPENPIMIGG